jgi:hypothetical protein
MNVLGKRKENPYKHIGVPVFIEKNSDALPLEITGSLAVCSRAEF